MQRVLWCKKFRTLKICTVCRTVLQKVRYFYLTFACFGSVDIRSVYKELRMVHDVQISRLMQNSKNFYIWSLLDVRDHFQINRRTCFQKLPTYRDNTIQIRGLSTRSVAKTSAKTAAPINERSWTDCKYIWERHRNRQLSPCAETG